VRSRRRVRSCRRARWEAAAALGTEAPLRPGGAGPHARSGSLAAAWRRKRGGRARRRRCPRDRTRCSSRTPCGRARVAVADPIDRGARRTCAENGGNENDLARFRVEVVFIPALTYFPGDRRPEYLRRWWA